MRIIVKYCRSRLFIAFLLGLISAIVQAGSHQSVLAPKDAAAMLANKQAIIVDVREDSEWQEQHIPGAVHIPLGQLDKRLVELNGYKNSPIITQCRSGMRSAQAQSILKSAGYTQVYNLDGGIQAWQQQGLATK